MLCFILKKKKKIRLDLETGGQDSAYACGSGAEAVCGRPVLGS